jgi:hypothetical protein
MVLDSVPRETTQTLQLLLEVEFDCNKDLQGALSIVVVKVNLILEELVGIYYLLSDIFIISLVLSFSSLGLESLNLDRNVIKVFY